MVDTIVSRVHDLKKHEALLNEINKRSSGTSKILLPLSPEELEYVRNSEATDLKTYIEYFADHRTERPLHIHYKNLKKLNNSGHYYLNVFVDYNRNFIEFSLSIPKYLFGTNILMFVDHHWNRDFKYFHNSSLENNLKTTFNRLINFIHYFFDLEFFGLNIVDFSLLEIVRIDLSFNQVFDCKKSALDYLEYQKKIRKKYLRPDSNSFRAYDTSLMYATKRFSFKIYHKGTEYKKHDKKEHEKINNVKEREYFNIDELQTFADRMLRYEVTIRDTMLSYLFNHRIFRKKCPIHKINYNIYKKVESAYAKNKSIASRASSFPEGILRETFLKTHPYITVPKSDENTHKMMTRLLNKKRQFLLKTNRFIEEYNSVTIKSSFDPRALFSKTLFNECAKIFRKLIKDFQVSEIPPENVVRDKILKYNSEHHSKYRLPLNEMLKILGLLKTFSFEELMKSGIYSRASFFRYKSRFEKIGITQNNIMLKDFIHPKVDLSLYHHNIIYNRKLINK